MILAQFAAECLSTIVTLLKKIDSSFIVTKNSLENRDICELMKYLNARSVVLNLSYMVGNYGGRTENFHELFVEIANTPFAVYVLFVQIYLRMYFNLTKSITVVLNSIKMQVFFGKNIEKSTCAIVIIIITFGNQIFL